MKNLAIYGAGGLGRETSLLVRQINEQSRQWKVLGFYDDGLKKGSVVDQLPVLGGLAELNLSKQELNVVVSIADPGVRKSVVKKITNQKISFPTLIHPACMRGDEKNEFGKGCILTAGVILTTGIKLGNFVIINLSSTLGHDARIGEFSVIMPGSFISGNVRIGGGTMIGTGARVLQNLKIGKNCKVGAGAVVTQNFPDGKTIVGIPAYEK